MGSDVGGKEVPTPTSALRYFYILCRVNFCHLHCCLKNSRSEDSRGDLYCLYHQSMSGIRSWDCC